MKNLLRNLLMFVVLVVVFSGLLSCKNNQTASGNNTAGAPQKTSQDAANSTVNTNNNVGNAPQNSTEDKKDLSEFPSVSPEIMQAVMTAPDGTNFKLEDFKGKVVLVNLWGIWCGPCKAEMPELVKLQDTYRDKDFEIIGLNVGDENLEKESPESITQFAEKMNLNYKLAQADDKLYSDFLKFSNYGGIPQSFLITRDGRYYGIFLGGGPSTIAKLKSNVEKAVNEN